MQRRTKAFENQIYFYYGRRCIRCNHTDHLTIHEIHPRSHFGNTSTPFTMQNCVILCGSCHDWAHRLGTNLSIPALTLLQQEWEAKHGRSNQKS